MATQLAALLQRPAVLTAIGAALAPFLAGARPANTDEGAAHNCSRSRGKKGGRRPAQHPPLPLPTAEQAMIASLQRQIASLEGVINTLRHELAESRGAEPRGEPAPALDPAALAAVATTTAAIAASAKKAAPKNPQQASVPKSDTARTAPAWQLVGGGPNRRSRNAQVQQPLAQSHRPAPPPLSWTGKGSG